ncbi:MAG: ribosome maturation factor RimM [Ignavibacteriaceae bacterium]
MPEFFLIAKIQSAFNKDGFVRISVHSDFPRRFFNLRKVYIDFSGIKKEFYVEEIKKKKDVFILKFANFNSDNDVEVLLGKDIFVDENDVVKLPEDQYFIHDIIGSTVFRNKILVGKIVDVLSLPANDVYVIDADGKEILIPAVKEFIEKFIPSEKKLILVPGADIDYNEN